MSDLIQRDENTELVRDTDGKLRRQTHPHIHKTYDNRRAAYNSKIDDMARGFMESEGEK